MARGLTFERAVIREFTGTAGATFVALFAIFCIHASGVPILDTGRRRRR